MLLCSYLLRLWHLVIRENGNDPMLTTEMVHIHSDIEAILEWCVSGLQAATVRAWHVRATQHDQASAAES